MRLAKTTRPSSAATVPRPRLFRYLDRAAKRPITWVWAPPGAGKTILIASYLVARHITNLWYQVDDGDNDIASFFYFLSLAAPQRRQPLPLLTPEYRQGLSTFTRSFCRELFARLKTRFVLVLDNYQEVPVDSPLHEVVCEAVAELPKGGRAIFISRTEPPPAFARLRAQRAMEILDWTQLRFTPMEAAGLLRRLAPGRWSRNTIKNLHKAADGWAAGLILSLEQLRRKGETSQRQKSESTAVLFPYFAGEILKKTDAVTQEVLLQTAFLPRVTAGMAEKLTGHSGAGQTLANLHKQNYFTNRLGGSEPTYEYHPLFREFLLAEARRTYSSARLDEIHRTGAEILEAFGEAEAAAGLLNDANYWEGLAQLICRHAPTLLTQGRAQTVEEWLAAIPQTLFESNPWLLYWRGMCELGTRHADCQRNLERAFTIFREQRDAAGVFCAWSALIISYQGESNAAPVKHWMVQFDELRHEFPEFPSVEIEARVAAGMLSLIAVQEPGHPEGARWAERAFELTRGHPDLAFRAVVVLSWIHYRYQLGDFSKDEAAVDEMRALMHARTVAPVIRVLASMTVVWSEFAHAQPSYRETVSSMLDLVQTHGLSEAAKHATLGCGIKAALSDGDLSTAQKWIDEMRKDLETLGPGYKGWYYASTMRMALLKDDVDEAAKQQSEMLRLSLASGATLACLDAHLISAEVFARRGRERKAQAHLGEAFEIVRNAGSPYFEFMARLTEAYLCLHRGQEAEGLNALGRAMELGRTGNYVNSFVWQPPVMAKLCAKALEAGIEVEYVRRLVRQRRLVPLEIPVELEAWPWPVKIFTLGRFEVMVDDQPLSGQRKVPLRLLTFLKALIALGAMEVPVTRLMDTLWPDTEDDTAKENLDKTLQRLRHLLGHEQILPVKGARVSLNPAICWTDAQAFERLAAKGAKDSDSASFGRAMELYRGPFLADEGDESWIDVTRERLRRKYHQTVFALVEAKERDGEPDRAIEYLRQAVGVDPLDEPIVCRLITLLVQNNRRTEALAVVQKYRKELAEFGVEASSRVDSLIQSPILNG